MGKGGLRKSRRQGLGGGGGQGQGDEGGSGRTTKNYRQVLTQQIGEP